MRLLIFTFVFVLLSGPSIGHPQNENENSVKNEDSIHYDIFAEDSFEDLRSEVRIESKTGSDDVTQRREGRPKNSQICVTSY